MDDTQHHNGARNNDGENTPLLSGEVASTPPKKQLSVAIILALTCINGGLQVFFSTVMANLSPYLQKLGLSKSATAAIIIALPLSGAFIGPTAGVLSDRLRTRYGRRRPIILGGAVLTIAFLLLLAWTEQIVRLFAGCPGQQKCHDSEGKISTASVVLAVIWTLLLSIAVQPVQAGVRALMVDIAPADEQSRVSAWASRIQGSMAIFSFFASSLNLPDLPGLAKLTQFQALACLNLITLGGTVLITCVFIKEKDSRRLGLEIDQQKSVLAVFRQLYQTVWEVPARIAQAYKVQFSSWFAWFPLLYYTTTFVGELDSTTAMGARQDNGNQLAQAGSIASLCFAIIGFFFSITLPIVLPYLSRRFSRNHAQHDADQDSDTGHRSLVWLWIGTQPVLGLILVLTLAAAYQWQGIALIALAGLPWAVTQWVPWAIIGYETSRLGLTDTAGDEDAEEAPESQAGAILGVHNMTISLPQVLSGAVSSATYKIAETAGSETPTAWVLAISGLAAFVAAYLARRVV